MYHYRYLEVDKTVFKVIANPDAFVPAYDVDQNENLYTLCEERYGI